jgi:hypothetical protein
VITVTEYTRAGREVHSAQYCDRCGRELLDRLGVPHVQGWHRIRIGTIRVFIDNTTGDCYNHD